jgi:hypothetical protein
MPILLFMVSGCLGAWDGSAGAGPEAPGALVQAPADAPPALPPEPDKYACGVDTDCVVAPYPYTDQPCCLGFASAHSAAWDAWLHLRCEGVACDHGKLPVRPSPSPPAACYSEPRCLAGRCGTACDAPSGN